jgi:hypothetical protein
VTANQLLHKKDKSLITSAYSGAELAARKLFLASYLCACIIFWWLPSIAYHFLKIADPIESWTIVLSILGTVAFVAGYLLASPRRRREIGNAEVLNNCEILLFWITLLLSVPAFICAALYSYSRIGAPYGLGDQIPGLYQLILYFQMFAGLIFLGVTRLDKLDRRRVLLAVAALVLPRFMISLNGARFFVVQAVVPVVFIAVARGWLQLTARRLLQFLALAAVLVFLPAFIRADEGILRGDLVAFFANGSSLGLLQDNLDMNLDGRCPPLVVSLTAKVIPYGMIGACTIDVFGATNLPATLGRILTHNYVQSDSSLFGTGSNYLLELYVTGGPAALVIGSLVFGFVISKFVVHLGRRSLYSGIFASCLPRALFAPRGDISYVFEWIPVLMLITVALLAAVKINALFRYSATTSQSTSAATG